MRIDGTPDFELIDRADLALLDAELEANVRTDREDAERRVLEHLRGRFGDQVVSEALRSGQLPGHE